MTAFSFMSSVFPVDQGPLKKINCCSQSMISASSFVHNALEVSLASLGLDLAFCRHTLHLGNNIIGYGAKDADWLGERHKGEALHQEHILGMTRSHALRPHFPDFSHQAILYFIV